MTKILKPYTIIPADLYVQRDADRQIKNIISDMGRPGYILVSRQMGKTNLLLNAKRKLETDDDVFLYIDLSNPFDNARSCFENIVDTAIEVNYIKFESVSSLILKRRENSQDIPPHKQHLSELRLLLSCIGGKLVIILDEIDALAKTAYSDLIFAQIRSMYFSRVNFKELEKLTYILSGVIEPIEIIKDPKISPFNIGQKIYLNDFNLNEFNDFLTRAQLNISEETARRVYYWTNGNPRMTWDLCSELENLIRRNELTEFSVDKIVKEIYLTSFDKPPIDNIRELVKKDRNIQNAIIEINYKKGKEISDKTKNKLYLAGIVNYVDGDVQIKNEIIKQSLTIEWIKTLDDQFNSVFRSAVEHSERGEYENTIALFEEYLTENEISFDARALSFFYLGEAYYYTKLFEKSVQYLENARFDSEDDPYWYYRNLNIWGSALYRLNKIPESLEKLKIVVESGRRDSEYARGLINYGITLTKSSEISQQNEAIGIFKKIIDETTFNKEKIQPEFVEELRATSYNYMARLQTKLENFDEARINYRKAIEISNAKQKPAIILALYDITLDNGQKRSLLIEIIELIETGQCQPVDSETVMLNEFSLDDFSYLVLEALITEVPLVERLFPYFSTFGKESVAIHLVRITLSFIVATDDWDKGRKALDAMTINFDSSSFQFDVTSKHETLKIRALGVNRNTDYQKLVEYFRFFSENEVTFIDQLCFNIFSLEVYELIQEKNLARALRYLRLIIDRKNYVAEGLISNYLVLYNLELLIYGQLKDRQRSFEVANKIIDSSNIDKLTLSKQGLLSEEGFKSIVSNAESIVARERPIAPARKAKVYNRNQFVSVKFKDGKTSFVKYKKIEKALQDGECFIID